MEPEAALELLRQMDDLVNGAMEPRPADCSAKTWEDRTLPLRPALADVIATTVLKLQCAVGYSVGWYGPAGKAWATGQDVLAIECANRGALGLLANLALRIVECLVARTQGALSTEQERAVVDQIEQFPAAERARGGTENFRMVIAAAKRRGLPISSPLPQNELLHLGQGAKRRNAYRHFPPRSDHIGVRFCANKFATARLMQDAGLPAQDSAVVLTEGQAVSAARRFGFPVVVKPNRTEYGTAVSVHLKSDEDVRRAFKSARKHGEVLVERYIPGEHYRLLVMYGEVVAVVRLSSARVIGDGQLSVRQLIEKTNAGRTAVLTTKLRKISIDDDALRILDDQGYGLDEVPPAGVPVKLRLQSNLSMGGTLERVTEGIHPDNYQLALRATRLTGLQVAGVDFITRDISRSWMDVGGGFVEINPTPGFFMGLPDGEMEDRFLDGIFPDGEDGRIPVVYVIGEKPADQYLGALTQTMENAGYRVAVATRSAVNLGTMTLSRDSASLAKRLSIAFAEPLATAAVIQLTLPEIVREGLGLDRCTTAVFLPAAADPKDMRRQRLAAAELVAAAAEAVVVAERDSYADPALGGRDPSTIWRLASGAFAGEAVQWQAAVEEALQRAGVIQKQAPVGAA